LQGLVAGFARGWLFYRPTATLLTDGNALLAGGYPNNDQATAQTWIYRP